MSDDRFWSKVIFTGFCWEWQGARTRGGYGVFKMGGANRSAHRVAYERLVGSIPDGAQLDHLCRLPECVNPDHLEPVTARENVRRSQSPAAKNVRKLACIHGHDFTKANTTIRRGGRRECRACMRRRTAAYKAGKKQAATAAKPITEGASS